MKITVDVKQEEKFPALYASKYSFSYSFNEVIPKVIILVEHEYNDHYVGTILESSDNEAFPVASKIAAPKHEYVRFNGSVTLQND